MNYFWKMIKVTCAIIVQNGKILLAQRGEHPHHPFQWEFPGGKVKSGETGEDCIRREINEELSLRIEIKAKLDPVLFDYGHRKIELIPFICFIREGKIQLSEHIRFTWIEWPEAAEMDISGADREIISNEKNFNLFQKYIGKQMNNSR